MIKGHAAIELKDEATGKVQRIEHDNMITNGILDAVTPQLGRYNIFTGGGTQYIDTEENIRNNNYAIIYELLGGIFLFENALEENVNNVDVPTNNKLVGKASIDAYSGIDISRGSYNVVESGVQDDGSFKHVWDFSTSQANGQISALALTTKQGGRYGIGIDGDTSDMDLYNISYTPFINLGLNNSNYYRIKLADEMSERCKMFFDYQKNELLYVKSMYQVTYNSAHASEYMANTGKLDIVKYKVPLSKLSFLYDPYISLTKEEVSVSIPEEFMNAISGYTGNFVFFVAKEYMYIAKAGTYSSQKFLRIKKSDLSVDVVEAGTEDADTFGSMDINAYYCGTNCNNSTNVANRYYYSTIMTDKYLFYVTNKTIDGTHHVRVTRCTIGNIADCTYVDFKSDFDSCYWRFMVDIDGYLYLSYFQARANGILSYCLNTETMTLKPNAGSFIGDYGYLKLNKGIYLKNHCNNSTPKEAWLYPYMKHNVLMTINNLSSPVTKTASQSMKITYTLTET